MASKDLLAELFDRIGCFFARLEIYTNVTPTTAMMGIITEILVEVLKIFGIATKELNRGSTSKFLIGFRMTLHFTVRRKVAEEIGRNGRSGGCSEET